MNNDHENNYWSKELLGPSSNGQDSTIVETEALTAHFEKYRTNEPDYSDNLKKILATTERLKAAKAKRIEFTAPILEQNGNPVLYPHTINVIQGQAGCHKSRLAENICASFLRTHSCTNELLGYKRKGFDSTHTVLYVDTERNLTEQLPYALQSIQTKAGYSIEAHPENFRYTSLLEIPRKERFATLKEFLDKTKDETSNPIVVVLDVSTDCIEDFNKVEKSMELIDLMNIAINDHDVTFLCLIHENPKSDKMRGHFGSELMNKASTVMQIAFEKDKNSNDTDIIRVKYLKCRSTRKHPPFYMKYCDMNKNLVLADESEILELFDDRKTKASTAEIIPIVEGFMGDGKNFSRQELIDHLKNKTNAADRTIEDRLKECIENESEFTDNEGRICHLNKEKQGVGVFYSLKPAETQ